MAVSQSAAKKTAAKKTTTKAAAPTPEKGSEVAPEQVEEATSEPTSDESTPEESNDSASADAAAGTDPEESGEGEQSDPAPEPEEEGAEPEDEGEQPLDSAQLAAIATSLDRSQMQSQAQARDHAASLAPDRDDSKATSQRAVAKRDRESMDAELTAGRTTPAAVIESVGADGHKAGTGVNDTLAPVDRSGLHGPSQDALNPAFAISVD